jgi:hypothetical protein
VRKAWTFLIGLLAQAADLAFGDAAHAKCFDQIVDRSGGDALDVSLLDDHRERLLRQVPRFGKAREIAAGPQLGDAQFHSAGAGLPGAVAVAIARRSALFSP